MEDVFGETVLLAQEAKLQQLADENRLLGAAADSLQQQLKAAQAQASAAQKRAAEAEARLRAKPAAVAAGAAGGDSQQLSEEVDRLKRRVANDRILLEQVGACLCQEPYAWACYCRTQLCSPLSLAARPKRLPQAERGRRGASQELSDARQEAAQLGHENVELQQRLAAAQRQVRQLESLQSFADSWDEQQQRERELTAALAQASGRVGQLEGRCASLERDLGQAAAALQAAQQLAAAAAEDRREEQQGHSRGRPDHQHQREQGQRAGSLSLSDLCDLEGAPSQFEAAGEGSPQRSSGQAGSSAGLPSRQRALQQQRQYQAEQQQRHRRQEQEQRDAETEAAGREVPLSLAASLQQQLLEQQRQLALLQLQQQMHASGNQSGGQQQQQQVEEGRQGSQLAALELEVGKLKRRNTQLQTALAEASLQHARAAAAGQRQLAELQQEAAQLQQQRDEAQQQLAQLQAAATALGFGDAGGGGSGGLFGGCSSEQLEELHRELLELAGRCNAAVEQNTGAAAALLLLLLRLLPGYVCCVQTHATGLGCCMDSYHSLRSRH